jgi:hypothetical protein
MMMFYAGPLVSSIIYEGRFGLPPASFTFDQKNSGFAQRQ